MNAQNAKDFLPLVQALADGKTIQMIYGDGTWHDLPDVDLSGCPKDYRIKPEPRRWWIVLSGESMSTDGINEYYYAYNKPVAINPYCKLIEVIEVQ